MTTIYGNTIDITFSIASTELFITFNNSITVFNSSSYDSSLSDIISSVSNTLTPYYALWSSSSSSSDTSQFTVSNFTYTDSSDQATTDSFSSLDNWES